MYLLIMWTHCLQIKNIFSVASVRLYTCSSPVSKIAHNFHFIFTTKVPLKF